MKAAYLGISILIGICCALWISFLFSPAEETSAAVGEAVILNNEVAEMPLTTHLQILRDANGTLEVKDLLQPPHNWNFVSPENEITNGVLTSAVYWLRFAVADRGSEQQWLLELANPSIDKATLYTVEPSGMISSVSLENAAAYGKRTNRYQYPVFELFPLTEGETTFFLRVESQGIMNFPVTIWERNAFEVQSRQKSAAFGLLGGLSLLFLGYCIKWFFAYRQKNFLYLFLLASSILAIFLMGTGLNWATVWPEFAWWNSKTIEVFLGIASISVLLLTKGLAKSTLLSAVINITAVLVLFALVYSYFAYQFLSLFPLFFLFLSVALSFGVSLRVREKGSAYAAHYTLGLFLAMTAIITAFLTVAAVLPYEKNIQTGLSLASGISLLLIAKSLLAKEKAAAEHHKRLERNAKSLLLMEMDLLKKENKRKDELLAFASNSLKAPLAGMIGMAESLQKSQSEKMSPAMVHQLTDLLESGKNVAHLANELLDFSKLKQLPEIHTESAALDDLCDKVLTMCRPLLQTKAVKLYHIVPDSLPNVSADPERVKQILYNLIENAIRHTHEGEIFVSARVKGHQLEVSVRDTRVDGQAHPIPSLLESDVPVDAHGIGLRITKNLIELQGGSLKIESPEGRGSVFSFNLPIQIDEQTGQLPDGFDAEIKEITASKLADSLVKKHTLKEGMRVLVIESEEINRKVLLHQLASAGYQVSGAAGGKEAVELLLHKPVELIVMDGYLADMSGDDLCRRIRLDYTLTELPILMLSNVDSLQEKKEAFTAGANDVLLKPCDKEEFLLRIETLANMRRLTQEITNMNHFLERNVNERTMALEITNMNLLTVNDEIQEIEKSRNDMLSAISHELGTPITLIHSYIQAVKESLIEENNPKYLDMIHKKLLLLERLTEDLMELTKYKAGHMTLRFEEKELPGWLKRLVDLMASDVEQSGRSFEFKGTENPDELSRLVLAVDVDRLDQVVSNILWNAVKHTSSEDGKITLSTEILANHNKEASLAEDADGELVIRIADNGCGIKKEALPHIFERFYKVDSSAGYKGSGLGLAIAKEIVLAHKGRIWADSAEGKESVFIIVLPLSFN